MLLHPSFLFSTLRFMPGTCRWRIRHYGADDGASYLALLTIVEPDSCPVAPLLPHRDWLYWSARSSLARLCHNLEAHSILSKMTNLVGLVKGLEENPLTKLWITWESIEIADVVQQVEVESSGWGQVFLVCHFCLDINWRSCGRDFVKRGVDGSRGMWCLTSRIKATSFLCCPPTLLLPNRVL